MEVQKELAKNNPKVKAKLTAFSRITKDMPVSYTHLVSIVRASGNGHWMTMGVIGELDACAVGCGECSGRFRAMSSSIDNFFSDPEFIFHVLL